MNKQLTVLNKPVYLHLVHAWEHKARLETLRSTERIEPGSARDTQLQSIEDELDERLAVVLAELPSGSGYDSPAILEPVWKDDSPFPVITAIKMEVPFHAMNEHGYYAGWCTYRYEVRPCFGGIDLIDGNHDEVPAAEEADLANYVGEPIYTALTKHIEA